MSLGRDHKVQSRSCYDKCIEKKRDGTFNAISRLDNVKA